MNADGSGDSGLMDSGCFGSIVSVTWESGAGKDMIALLLALGDPGTWPSGSAKEA